MTLPEPAPPTCSDALVLLPRPGSLAASLIPRGSGVVAAIGRERLDPEVHDALTSIPLPVWFISGRTGAIAQVAWADRVHAAAGSLARFPMRPRGRFMAQDFLPVGRFTLADARLELFAEPERELAVWLGRRVRGRDLVTAVQALRAERELAAELFEQAAAAVEDLDPALARWAGALAAR